MIEDLIVYIKLHDTAPSAFDIPMKSTAFVYAATRFALEKESDGVIGEHRYD